MSSHHVVAVTVPFPPDPQLQARLAAHSPAVEVQFVPYLETREHRAARGANSGVLPDHIEAPPVSVEAQALLARATIVFGLDLPPNLRELAPNLQWVQTVSAGLDQIDTALLQDMGVRLSGASGIASASIAEFVMARLLEVWKNLRQIESNQRAATWVESFGSEVGGRTLVIAGLGSIGRELARRARAFDMTVLATRNSAAAGDTDPDVDELHPAANLADLLPRADAVVAALPTSPATVDLFDAAMFAKMRPDAIFANVGRGTLVVEQDLIDTLEQGHLRAAILDVMREEPLPAESALWASPRVYLSPHAAVSLDRYQENGTTLFVENLQRLVAGESLINEFVSK